MGEERKGKEVNKDSILKPSENSVRKNKRNVWWVKDFSVQKPGAKSSQFPNHRRQKNTLGKRSEESKYQTTDRQLKKIWDKNI